LGWSDGFLAGDLETKPAVGKEDGMEVRVQIGERVRARRFPEGPVLIGQHAAADLQLPGAVGVNRRHAVVVKYLGGWTIHDLHSVNGVYVNGKRTRRADLAPGDEIKIGKALLVWVGDGSEPKGPTQSDDWSSVLDGGAERAVFASRCRLTIDLPGGVQQDFETAADCIIGSSPRATVRIAEPGVSSLHCLLARDSGAWYLHDLRSDSGLIHNGRRLRTISLTDGDAVIAGPAKLTIRLLRDAMPVKTPPPISPFDSGSFDQSSGGSSGNLLLPPGDELGSAVDIGAIQIPAEALELAKQARRAFMAEKHESAVDLMSLACELSPWTATFRKHLRFFQIKACRRAPSDSPGQLLSLAWHQTRARRAVTKRKWEAALARCERGLRHDPWNRGLLMLEAAVFEEKKLFDQALWSLQSARRRNPSDPRICRPAAKLFHHLGAYDRSVACWQIVAKAYPHSREIEDSLRRVMVEKTVGGGGRLQKRSD
jgi:pSer/pThr/pTyr-binding forkhead associated (FHA) protein